jgi:hypothetical protein
MLAKDIGKMYEERKVRYYLLLCVKNTSRNSREYIIIFSGFLPKTNANMI